MPGALHHRIITRQALASCRIADGARLSSDYCIWPDDFHSRYEEIKPYLFIKDGIEFHYLPHTPVEEFYRYWRFLPDKGVTRQAGTRPNDNQRMAEAGFAFYQERIVAALRRGEKDEAYKYLGCLLHLLEDQCFGIHALEGPEGTDIFVLDRLSGMPVCKKLCALPLSEKLYGLTVTPQVFTGDAKEFVPLLYRRYAASAEFSRRELFRMAMEYINGTENEDVIRACEKNMFLCAVQQAADTTAALFALAGGTHEVMSERSLGDFEPFFYPVGGGGSFPLRKCGFDNGVISFGVNHEAKLLYDLPESLYRRFRGKIYGSGIGRVQIKIINAGKAVESFTLTGDESITLSIDAPNGVFGIVSYAVAGSGELHLADAVLSI